MYIDSFSKIVGHKNILNYLQRSLLLKITPNIILLSGSAGIGKSTIAKVLACELVKEYSENYARVIESVCKENRSTENILMFNLSQMKESEEVKNVREAMQPLLNQNGPRVLILDEAHGLTNEQQDSLLVGMESLHKNVYMIICTTDVSSLRDAFLSRCKVHLRLRNLSVKELEEVAETIMERKGLKVSGNKKFILASISTYCKDEPRRIINLFNLFEDGHLITQEDLNLFMNTDEPKQAAYVLKYLYSSNYVQGFDYIRNYPIDITTKDIIQRACVVALGNDDSLFPKDITIMLRQLLSEESDEPLLGFIKDISKDKLTRGVLVSAFLNNNKAFKKVKEKEPEKPNELNNISSIYSMGEATLKVEPIKGERATSIRQLFEGSD